MNCEVVPLLKFAYATAQIIGGIIAALREEVMREEAVQDFRKQPQMLFSGFSAGTLNQSPSE